MPLESVQCYVEKLLKKFYASPNAESDCEQILALVTLIRKGNAALVLENVKEYVKHGSPVEQERSIIILDQLLLNCTGQVLALLSSEKWSERFLKVAKSARESVARKIIQTVILWQLRYGTDGFKNCAQRFAQSKTLRHMYNEVQQRLSSDKSSSAQIIGVDGNKDLNKKTQDLKARMDRRHALNHAETILMQAQGDLASLEYVLEHPNVLQDEEVARDCKQRKIQCARLLENDQYEEFAAEIMQLIERFSEALEIYDAMSGYDMSKGNAAPGQALSNGDGEVTAPVDSEDEEHQRRVLQRAAPRKDAEHVMLEAQEETRKLLDKERSEMASLRKELEELRRKHEELQNKYKDAKAKNRDAVAALEEYADLIETMKTEGASGSQEAMPISGAKGNIVATAPGSSVSLEIGRKMRDSVQVMRQFLREIREQYVNDIKKESAYYSLQLTSAIASIVAAAQKERGADHKALLWTQELYKKELRLRKQYYNTIQELKGNIRVYCRVRPMLSKEKSEGQKNVIESISSDELKIIDNNGCPKFFEFDEVYLPTASQAKVFEDTCPLIDSVVDGYNVCIFAYGQTGSGKTYTMGGGEDESKGINGRALQRLFEVIEERSDTEESSVFVSVLEIYCETIRDLLAGKEAAKMSYEVKQGGPYGTYVTNLSEVPVKSTKDVNEIMERASRNRSEGQTNMNEHSSRSHMILFVIVQTVNKQTKMQSFGKLSLVDLAGSERLDRSGVEGQQLKETVSINKSLSALGDVIAGLAQNSKHVPFRNSLLTFLLRDSMGGQAKVLMFVCVSPASSNCSESCNSLQFASRARGVALGQVKRNLVKAA